MSKWRFELPRGVYISAEGYEHFLKTVEEGYVFPPGTKLKCWNSNRGFQIRDISGMTFKWFEPGNAHYASEVLLEMKEEDQ